MRRMLLPLLLLVAAGPLACAGTSTGQACTEDAECDSDQRCFVDLPGGYCSTGCSAEGSVAECPADTVCAMHADRQLCSPVCEDQGDCREGYECNGVSGTSVKVCRPKA